MRTRCRPAALIAMALLLIVVAGACKLVGPHLSIDVDNTGGPQEVTVTVDSGRGPPYDGDTKVPPGQGSSWSVPIGSTWEGRVDGRHLIGSGDRADLPPPPPGPWPDLVISIRVNPDGTAELLDVCFGEHVVNGRCVAP